MDPVGGTWHAALWVTPGKESGFVNVQIPQLTKPGFSDHTRAHIQKKKKGWNRHLLSNTIYIFIYIYLIYFLLPSFVFSSSALKKLLIIISVQFEMQA